MYVVYYYDVAMSMYAGEARLTAEIPQRDRLGCRSGFTPTCPPVNRIDSGRPHCTDADVDAHQETCSRECDTNRSSSNH